MSLYRAFFTVGGLTLLSRITGFGRDVVFAALLGAGPVAEAFVVAFRLPNLFRRWFGEGAFNAAFIPLFTRRLNGDGKDAARAFAGEAFAGLTFVLVILSVLCIAAMPLLAYALAPGFSTDPAKFDLTVAMSRIAFPYLLCMSLVALLSGVLNAVGRFVESAAVPILLNLVLIATMALGWWLGYGNDARTGHLIVWGVTVAGVVQLLYVLNGVRRAGLLPRLTRPKWSADMKRLVALGVPGIIAGGVTQINIVIGSLIASLEAGAVSYLYYADRLYQLPLSLVGVAIGVVLLPNLTKHLSNGDHSGVRDAQNRALEFALLLTMPAAFGLAVIPSEIVSLLYERGAFVAADTKPVAAALAIFALGLPAFVLIKVLSPGFFAREDTRTPARYAAISLVLNTAGSIALFFTFKAYGLRPFLGIAVATTLGGWINAWLLWRELRRRGQFEVDARIWRNLVWIFLSALAMGIWLAIFAEHAGPWMVKGQSTWQRAGLLAGLISLASVIYFGALALTGVISPRGLIRALRRG